MSFKLRYLAEKNPNGRNYPGVPLNPDKDITEEEFNSYPEHIQGALLSSPFYQVITPDPVIEDLDGGENPPEEEE